MTVRFVRLCFIGSKAEAPSSTDSDDDDDDDDPTAFTQKTETERWSVGEQVCPKRETEAQTVRSEKGGEGGEPEEEQSTPGGEEIPQRERERRKKESEPAVT